VPKDQPSSFAQAGAFYRVGAFTDAERVCRALLGTNADGFDPAFMLGVLRLKRRAVLEAIVWLRHAVALRPHDALVRDNLALALIEGEHGAEAIVETNAAMLFAGPTAERLNTLGIAYLADHQPEAALAAIDRARAMDPALLAARFTRGRALIALHRFAEAEAETRALLPLAPPDRRSLVMRQLARAIAEDGRWAESWAVGQAHLAVEPDDVEMHWNMALVGLVEGRMPVAWRHYEYRWRVGHHTPAPAGHMVVDPDRVAGKRVLVTDEQGIGDVIQFVRYAALLADRGAEVWLAVPPALVSLFATLRGPRGVVATHDPRPPPDQVCSVMSLPLAFGTDLTTIPAAIPYLDVPFATRARWGSFEVGDERPRIGLVWSGSAASAARSAMPAALLAPLAERFPGASFHCLQRDIAPADRSMLALITTHDTRLVDFADTAALIARMDLVISIDTAVAHLAGALGKPVWTLLAFEADWRWLLDRDDSPWYPTMRLFRQTAHGDWPGVVARVQAALAAWLDGFRSDAHFPADAPNRSAEPIATAARHSPT
jgi:tetratricopeptide (TPR) repeat protein